MQQFHYYVLLTIMIFMDYLKTQLFLKEQLTSSSLQTYIIPSMLHTMLANIQLKTITDALHNKVNRMQISGSSVG